MKRFTMAVMLGLMIVALSATVYAQPKLDFRVSGFLDVVTEWWKNAVSGTYGATGGEQALDIQQVNKSNAYVEQRLRLKFDMVMGKELSGTIFFEGDSTNWGDTNPSGSQRNSMGYWSADRAALEIKNVYIDWAIPYFGIPVPMMMRAGIQPFSIRNDIFAYTDGAGVKVDMNPDPFGFSLMWFKPWEGRQGDADDVDVYGLWGQYKYEKLTFGAYGTYWNMNTVPINLASNYAYGVNQSFQADMWWFGAYMDGKMGPVMTKFDFVYDFGNVDYRDPYQGQKLDFNGWVVRGYVTYPWELFEFGGAGMYASGDDYKKTGRTHRAGDPSPWYGGVLDPAAPKVPAKKVNAYVVPPGSESPAIAGDSLVMYSSWVNRGNTGIANRTDYAGLAGSTYGGTWFLQAFGTYKPCPWYKATLKAFYIGDTTKNGDTFGSRRDASGTLKDNNTIGWEFDFYNEFQIYKNLKYTLAGGYMLAGDAFSKQTAYIPAGNALGIAPGYININLKDPWIITSCLIYNF